MARPDAGCATGEIGHNGAVSWQWGSVWPVWALALVGAIVVGVLQPSDGLVWLPIVLGGCTLTAFAIQLAGPTMPGIVGRLAAAVLGSVVILAVATAILVPLTLL